MNVTENLFVCILYTAFATILSCRCRKWVQNTRRDDERGKSVEYLCGLRQCSEYFEDSQFMNKETKNKLVWNAVPSIFAYQILLQKLLHKKSSTKEIS